MRRTGPTAEVIEVVHQRSGWMCEHCHQRRAAQQHHRRPRGMGGTRRPDANCAAALVDLCLECHGLVESERAWARDHGWLIRQTADPATERVWLGGRWVLLDPDRPLYLEPAGSVN